MTDPGEGSKLSMASMLPGSVKGADPTIDHPVSGRRQFGMEQLKDGRYRFYTRGFDRQTNAAMDMQLSKVMCPSMDTQRRYTL